MLNAFFWFQHFYDNFIFSFIIIEPNIDNHISRNKENNWDEK